MKGDHVYYENLLERHLDGELSPDDRNVLFAHLEHCEECREILDAEELLIENLSRIPRLQPPADLRARILAEVAREREQMMQPFTVLDDEDTEEGLSSKLPKRGSVRPVTFLTALFAVFSTLLFLLTADFRAIPPLADVQQVLRQIVSKAAAEFADFVRPSSVAPPPPAIPPAAEEFSAGSWVANTHDDETSSAH